MKVFLDVMVEQKDNSHSLTDAKVFEDLYKMLTYLVNFYPNIINLRQLDEEDKEKGDLYFEVYVKQVR